jgi:hypothetical protein
MACVDFLGQLHNRTKRDYVARVVQYDKAACAEVAKKYGQDYWDGERQYGYGGYKYDRAGNGFALRSQGRRPDPRRLLRQGLPAA